MQQSTILDCWSFIFEIINKLMLLPQFCYSYFRPTLLQCMSHRVFMLQAQKRSNIHVHSLASSLVLLIILLVILEGFEILIETKANFIHLLGNWSALASSRIISGNSEWCNLIVRVLHRTYSLCCFISAQNSSQRQLIFDILTRNRIKNLNLIKHMLCLFSHLELQISIFLLFVQSFLKNLVIIHLEILLTYIDIAQSLNHILFHKAILRWSLVIAVEKFALGAQVANSACTG